jgi:osmoprotectant transport system permease protein
VTEWLRFAAERAPELWQRVSEHLVLTGISTAAAVVVGLPLGVYLAVSRRAKGPMMGAVGILQTIPSLAMLVLLLALFDRIGALPALVALTLYALLPIVRNTTTGLEEVAPELLEAASGLGMTRRQEILWVRLPLAAPVIVAGIRTAAVIGVGIATLSAFIGAGGLGEFINRGLALADTDLILLGAIPAGSLALIVDFSLAGMQWGLTRPRVQPPPGRRRARYLRPLAAASPLLLVGLGVAAHGQGRSGADGGRTVVVGSKNFTEQLILAEMMAQAIERTTDLEVERRLNLGGTMICHEALVLGGIDIYAEYTGTALTAVLEAATSTPPDRVYATVLDAYATRWSLVWLSTFGFDNTYVVAVAREAAEREGWSTISDMVPEARSLRAGMTSEFAERPDGITGFRGRYGVSFGQERSLDPGIMYRAVAEGEVDLIFAFATDARLEEFGLRVLEDDLGFFPPYEAAPVVRASALDAHPGLRDGLEALAGALPDSVMRRLNHEVDVQGRSPADVAGAFLTRIGVQ